MNATPEWVEVWIDSSPGGEYLLMVRRKGLGAIEIVDPQEGKKVIQTFSAYEDALHWLNEDEYDLAAGRYHYSQ